MARIGKGLTVAAFVVVAAVLVSGCGFSRGSGLQLTLGYMEWDENVANSTLVKVILEDELGYEQVELQRMSNLDEAFEGVSSGELDAFTDVWMPNHRDRVQKAGDDVELSKKPWYEGVTSYGMAVPDYMDARSIEDLNSSGADVISGIEPGLPMMERIDENVIPEYGLELGLIEGPTPAMLAELDQMYQAREPIVFLAWSPHWMNQVYDFHYLEDPKNTQGDLDEPSKLHTLFREGLSENDPVGYALINAMRLNKKQVGDIELSIKRADSPEEGIRGWLERHPGAVEPWVEDARRADG